MYIPHTWVASTFWLSLSNAASVTMGCAAHIYAVGGYLYPSLWQIGYINDLESCMGDLSTPIIYLFN